MSFMKNINIGKKIAIMFAIVLAVSILTTGIGLWQLEKMRSSTQAMMALPLAKERLVSDWYRIFFGGARRTLAIAKSTDPVLATFFKNEEVEGAKDAGKLIKQFESLLSSPEETALFKQVTELRAVYNGQKDLIRQAKEAGDAATADKLLTETFVPLAAKYQEMLGQLQAMQRKAIDDNARAIEDAAAASVRMQAALSVMLALLVIGCAVVLKESIVRPLAAAIAVARRVAQGDLSTEVEVTSQDEAGQLLEALRDMNNALRGLVINVMRGADSIAGASSEIAHGNLELSSRTEHQASSLEQTASSMEELTSTVKQTADNAVQANRLAASASDVAGRGGAVVREVVSTMQAIDASSKKIVDIISVIDGIAFQTNILALNAAVEAARAGEQGRGFAVVAGEVRSLAHRSAAAAKEIKVLIDDSVGNVGKGSALVEQAGSTMDEIVASVKRVTDIMGEINVATREQTTGIEQINGAIGQMDHVTQQNAALVEEAAAASGTLQRQAAELAEAVQAFKLDHAAARIRPPAPRKSLAAPV